MILINTMKFIAFIFIFSTSLVLAQDNSDTTSTDKDWEKWKKWEEEMNDRWGDFSMDFLKNAQPTIVLNYGLSNMSLNNFRQKFADPNMIELQLGYTNNKMKWLESIFQMNYRFVSVSNISNKISGNKDGLSSEMWRIGVGRTYALGYKFGKSALIPYYSNSLIWSRLNMGNQISDSTDNDVIDHFNKAFRFGTSSKGGIEFQVTENIGLNVEYERSIVFPRHLFWKWAGSVLIEASSQSLLDEFVEAIYKSSPYAAPIVNFILKNALSYGLYELRQEKMNWPFDTAAPLSYDQFKFGLSFVF